MVLCVCDVCGVCVMCGTVDRNYLLLNFFVGGIQPRKYVTILSQQIIRASDYFIIE